MNDGVLAVVVSTVTIGGLCCIFLFIYATSPRLRYLLNWLWHSSSGKRVRKVYQTSLRGNLVRTYHRPVEDDFFLDREQELGKGGCGVVIFGEEKTSRAHYAIKVVNKFTAERPRLDREIKLMKDVDHANIVRLFSVYEVPSHLFFVMELCLGGHLGNLLARQPPRCLDEDWGRRLTTQLLSAIAHIHSRGIAHRDIKLQNILIDHCDDRNAQLKLIDFGYGSRYIGNLPMRTKCGTPYTTAPEVIRECYDERCDVWSCGVVIYIMLSGRRPFEALNIAGPLADAGRAAMITNILAGRYHFNHKSWQRISKEGINFVRLLLNPDYKTRLRSHMALEHSWLRDSTAIASQESTLKSSRSFKALKNMQKSQSSTDMQRTGMVALVFGLQPKAAVDMRTVFQSFDLDGTGALSLYEFRNAMRMLAPELKKEDADHLFDVIDIDRNKQISYTEFLVATLDPSEVDIEELSKAFKVLDEDGDGFITAEELHKVLKGQHEQAKANETIVQAETSSKSFTQYPLCEFTGLPKIPLKDLFTFDKRRVRRTRSSTSDFSEDEDRPMEDFVNDRVQKIFRQADINQDGKISYGEFLWAMTGLDDYLPLVLGDIHDIPARERVGNGLDEADPELQRWSNLPSYAPTPRRNSEDPEAIAKFGTIMRIMSAKASTASRPNSVGKVSSHEGDLETGIKSEDSKSVEKRDTGIGIGVERESSIREDSGATSLVSPSRISMFYRTNSKNLANPPTIEEEANIRENQLVDSLAAKSQKPQASDKSGSADMRHVPLIRTRNQVAEGSSGQTGSNFSGSNGSVTSKSSYESGPTIASNSVGGKVGCVAVEALNEDDEDQPTVDQRSRSGVSAMFGRGLSFSKNAYNASGAENTVTDIGNEDITDAMNLRDERNLDRKSYSKMKVGGSVSIGNSPAKIELDTSILSDASCENLSKLTSPLAFSGILAHSRNSSLEDSNLSLLQSEVSPRVRVGNSIAISQPENLVRGEVFSELDSDSDFSSEKIFIVGGRSRSVSVNNKIGGTSIDSSTHPIEAPNKLANFRPVSIGPKLSNRLMEVNPGLLNSPTVCNIHNPRNQFESGDIIQSRDSAELSGTEAFQYQGDNTETLACELYSSMEGVSGKISKLANSNGIQPEVSLSKESESKPQTLFQTMKNNFGWSKSGKKITVPQGTEHPVVVVDSDEVGDLNTPRMSFATEDNNNDILNTHSKLDSRARKLIGPSIDSISIRTSRN